MRASLSIQIFLRCWISQANHRSLICGLCSCMERFQFFVFSHTAPGAQLWFWPQLCMWAILRHLLPTQVRGDKGSNWVGHACSVRWERDKVAMTGEYTLPPVEPPLEPTEAGAGRRWWPNGGHTFIQAEGDKAATGACTHFLRQESLPVPAESGTGVWGERS